MGNLTTAISTTEKKTEVTFEFFHSDSHFKNSPLESKLSAPSRLIHSAVLVYEAKK